jgi:leucyl aminopeptidase
LPVDIDVITVAAAGPRPLDDFLTGPGAPGDIDIIAVPVRREQCRTLADAGSGTGAEAGSGDGGWASLTGIGTEALGAVTGMTAAEAVAVYELSGKAGETARMPVRTPSGLIRLILLGVGDGAPADLRRAGAALARQVGTGRAAVATLPAGAPDESLSAFSEGVLLGGYKFSLRSHDQPGQAREDARSVRVVVSQPDSRPAAGRAAVIAEAVALARDLVNMPSAQKTPEWLAAQAVAAAGRAGLGVRVRDEAELAEGGFGGILAVGSGSARPPRMIELTYAPERPGDADSHIVLAGKGITFDSGGLSLKPPDGMKLMKTDMSGGAAVIAVMAALPALGVRARVTGLIAAAENMPSGSAMRPGDVITAFGGRTIEVLNTDAEGRLVLADLLAYADTTLEPDVTVDLATLTGAARIALGASIGALYASDDRLAEALRDAGTAAGEPLWRMPMPDDYQQALTSVTADIAHIPSSMNGARNGQAGSIVAAMFLREFTGGRPWAHLDIAGPARAAGDDGEITKGGTGFGTRLLLRWLAGFAD